VGKSGGHLGNLHLNGKYMYIYIYTYIYIWIYKYISIYVDVDLYICKFKGRFINTNIQTLFF
jgi:hypothetical protein